MVSNFFCSKNNFDKNKCVYGDLYSEVFLEKHNFKCFKSYIELDAAKERPYYVMQNHRNLKRSDPKESELEEDCSKKEQQYLVGRKNY